MKNSKIFIGIFLTLLIAPMVLFPLISGMIDTENHENRAYAEFPDILDNPADFPAGFDSWFNDRLPFKNQLKKIHSAINLALFNTTSSARVVVGMDGWLFYNNYGVENPIDDILGKSTFSEEESEIILNNVREADSGFAGNGSRFVLMVPPNKETIYNGQLPNWLGKKITDQTRMDLLYGYLEENGVTICYPKDALLTAKDEVQLYYLYDTHWNKLGGYIGFRELCGMLDISLPELQTYKINKGEGGPRDLAELSGMGSVYTGDSEYTIDYNSDVSVTSEAYDGYTLFHSDGPENHTVMLVHDSYYESIIDYFTRTFTTVVEVPRNYSDLYGTRYLIDEYTPDIIVMEVVERGAGILFREYMPY